MDESTTLENTLLTITTHATNECKTIICSIHNRTNHAMRTWPQHYRYDRGIMERICEHGTGHPDPDDYRIITGLDPGVHGCCGCEFKQQLEEK